MHERSATRLSTQIVHRGRVFSAVRDQVRLPNGRQATMDVVRHPPSVVLLAMPDAAHIVLVRQYRYSIDDWIWELPAGSVDEGEEIEAAVRRECHEEIGRIASHVEPVAELYPTPGYCDELMVFFKLYGLSAASETAQVDDDEILEPRVFTVAEARSLVARGEVRDMKTVVGLTMIE